MPDYIVRETAGNRIQVISRPLTLPGCCAICGYVGTNEGDRADIRVFLDFQLDIDYYGRVYWCSACLLEAANALGWLSVDQAEELRRKITEQESELIVLREQNERLRSSLSSLLGRADDPSVPVLLGAVEHERGKEQSSEGAESDSESDESSSDEPVSVEGRTSVPTDSSGDGPITEFRL